MIIFEEHQTQDTYVSMIMKLSDNIYIYIYICIYI